MLNFAIVKKVLVTGSNGLLGQKLCDLYLPLEEIDFLATARGKNRYPSTSLSYQEMDISQKGSVQKVLQAFRPDCVIHTAAMTDVDDCEENPKECDLLNVEAVKFLVETCNAVGAHFIHLSTDFIFDGQEGPYSEEAVPNPLCYYGKSKLRAEEYVQEHCKSWSILRTVLVYGLVQDMSRSNIVLWAKNALLDKKVIRVVDDQFRTPTLAEDLALGCRLAEMKEATGVFHISGKDFMSIYELVKRVANAYQLSMENVEKVSSQILNQKAQRPSKTGFVLEKARSVLGFMPRSFEEGIALVERQFQAYR